MKQLFFRYILGIIPVIAFFSGAYAQSNKLTPENFNSSSKEVAYGSKNPNNYAAPADVSAKAIKDFSKSFKGVEANWFKVKDGFIAQFTRDDIYTRVDYNLKGKYVAMIRRYSEDKLPKDVRHLVRSNFYDYTISIVIEVTTDNGTAYLVKIEDEKRIKTIRVVDGEWDVYEDYVKSK